MKQNIVITAIALLFSMIIGQSVYTETNTNKKSHNIEARKHFSFAVQLKKNKNYKDAIIQYKKSIGYDDSLYQVHYSYADLLMKLGKRKEAKQSFLKTISIEPKHFNSAAILAKIYYEDADYDSALVMYEIMHNLKPKNSKILANIAMLREYLEKEGALEDYEKLISEGDNSYEIIIHTSRLALKQNDIEKANHYAVMAIDRKPGDTTAMRIAAHTSLVLGKIKTASIYLKEIFEQDSTDVSILLQLEKNYRTLVDYKNLIWALERHHELVPKDSNILGELAELLYSHGMMDRGIEYVKKGMEIDSSDGRFHILMGEHYRELGQNEKALAEYKLALKDERWKPSAKRLIWQIEKPETDEEKKERDFFNRSK